MNEKQINYIIALGLDLNAYFAIKTKSPSLIKYRNLRYILNDN